MPRPSPGCRDRASRPSRRSGRSCCSPRSRSTLRRECTGPTTASLHGPQPAGSITAPASMKICSRPSRAMRLRRFLRAGRDEHPHVRRDAPAFEQSAAATQVLVHARAARAEERVVDARARALRARRPRSRTPPGSATCGSSALTSSSRSASYRASASAIDRRERALRASPARTRGSPSDGGTKTP